MADLEPITREESFLNGTDLEPITRKELFYAGRENELPEGHREPKTREEWFIKKYREAGDVTVESLSVTENGTYTAPEGKAYSPVSVDVQPTLISKSITANGDYSASSDNADGYSSVSVNVPLPENAYLLKEIENVDIATFTDGSDLPMPKLEVGIEPQQDLHGYDAPWVGGAGKNKLENKLTTRTYNGVTATVKEDGTVTLTGTATVATNFFLNTELNLTGNYTISGCPSGGSEDSYYMNALIGSWGAKGKDTGNGIYSDGGTITNVAITVANGYSFPSGGITFKPMIESGNTKTTYEPYSNICPISGWDEVNVTVADATTDPTVSNVYTIDLDGTRYGGTLDLVSGVLTVDRVYIVYDGSSDEDWRVYGGKRMYITISDYKSPTSSVADDKLICDRLKTVAKTQQPSDTDSFTISGSDNNSTQIIINVGTTSGSDTKEWLASNNIEVVYPLATPLTIQLTPTQVKSLVGQNNAWANTGKILDLSYLAKEE